MNRRAFLTTAGIGGILLARQAPAVILLTRRRATTYLISEDCEGTGTPAGWTNQGTIDWDEAAVSAPQGSQCVECNWSANPSYVFYEIAAQNTVSLFFAFRRSQAPSSTYREVSVLLDTSNVRARMEINNVNARLNHGSAQTTIAKTGGFTNNTWYYMWYSYTAGSGLNGVMTAWVGNSADRSTADTGSLSNGTSTTTVNRPTFGYSSGFVAGNQIFFDKIRVASGANSIGSNPI